VPGAPYEFLRRSAAGRLDTGASALDQEILAEKAAALGRLGSRVEASLGRLREHDQSAAEATDRPGLLADAADAVWCFFVQRELCGLKDQSAVIADYAIPREVLVRLGAR
jgi:hypothetical protein